MRLGGGRGGGEKKRDGGEVLEMNFSNLEFRHFLQIEDMASILMMLRVLIPVLTSVLYVN